MTARRWAMHFGRPKRWSGARCALNLPGRHALLLGFAAAVAVPVGARADVLNPGFEFTGGSLWQWTTFGGSVFADTTTPRTGTHVAKVFGGFQAPLNYTGLFQSLPAAAGQSWQARAFVRHNTGDSLAGTANLLSLKIEFYSVYGGTYGTPEMLGEHGVAVLDAAAAPDTWLARELTAVAPAGTREARLALVFTQVDYATGAALIDDVAFVPDTPAAPGWQLVWSDEFTAGTVDAANWRVADIHWEKNNELEYYAPDDVFAEEGQLVLRSQRRPYWGYDNHGNWRYFDYTSGLVDTAGLYPFRYGRVEIRAQVPAGHGLWPAHWMMAEWGGWPPEIDITEMTGDQPWRDVMSHHWGPLGPNGEPPWEIGQTAGCTLWGPDFSQGFHVFAIEWWPGAVHFFVDEAYQCSSVRPEVPAEPMHLILNTAVGGSWPGWVDDGALPAYHRIDYVRVCAPADPGPPLQGRIDITPAAPVADGVLSPGEYAPGVAGINNGFAGRLGAGATMYVETGADGSLCFALHSATALPATGSYVVVIYLDTQPGGHASTAALVDGADRARRAASGRGTGEQRSDLYFAPGFAADYALCLEAGYASVLALGRPEHGLVNGAALGATTDAFGGIEVRYAVDDGSSGGRVRELRVPLAAVGLAPRATVRWVATLLNADTAFRMNEFVGVAPGNSWDGTNPGPGDVLLKEGDFVALQAASGRGDADADGDIDGADLVQFSACLAGPAVAPSPAPPWSAADCRDVFDFDGDTDNDVADLAALQRAQAAGA